MSNNKEFTLYTAYDNLMDQYAEQFEKLFRDNDSEQTFPIGEWISRDRRGVYEINDYYISYDDMRTCVDNGLSFDEFYQWYHYCMRLIQIDTAIKTPTLEEWVQGCDLVKDDEMKKIEDSFKRLQNAELEFDKAMEDFKQKNANLYTK